MNRRVQTTAHIGLGSGMVRSNGRRREENSSVTLLQELKLVRPFVKSIVALVVYLRQYPKPEKEQEDLEYSVRKAQATAECFVDGLEKELGGQ